MNVSVHLKTFVLSLSNSDLETNKELETMNREFEQLPTELVDTSGRGKNKVQLWCLHLW